MKYDPYTIKARLFPAILTSIPLVAFYHLVIAPIFSAELITIHSYLPLAANVSLSMALIFLMSQINRIISKEVFQLRYFQNEAKMPTTDYLLWAHPFFSNEFKQKIRNKISEKYGMDLLAADSEKDDEISARKSITGAVSQIRNSLRGNALLLQHNIEYGFVRNLIGGCAVSVLFALLLLILGYWTQSTITMWLGAVFLFVYSIPLTLSKYLMNRYGQYYCKILYEQFLTETQ